MQVLAVGSHPDDVEIGAAGLVAKLAAAGHDVYILVLTDDQVDGSRRREEAQRSGKELGIQMERLVFAAFRDGFLRADRGAVTHVRHITAAAGISPDLVIVHSSSDSHNDHVEAHRLARAAFRGCVFLYYSIYLSNEDTSFRPSVFVEITPDIAALKERALTAHRSQAARLSGRALTAYERRWGALAGMDRAEALEIMAQNNSRSVHSRALSFSDSPFHRFWSSITGGSAVSLLYAVQPPAGAVIDWPTPDEAAGRDELRRSFAASWHPRSPLVEYASDHPQAEYALRHGHVILLSSGVGTDAFHGYRAHLGPWSVAFDVPRTEHPFVLDERTGRHWHPVEAYAGGLSSDVGILSNRRNPFSPPHRLLRVAGATAFASRAALSFLANPRVNPLLQMFLSTNDDVSLVFEVNTSTSCIRVLSLEKRGLHE
ncbi:PIG-L deacetylase family protein [Streptomyces tendae]|uniref:PIG-L deacetylase family protein n=1 Tax=Streptomyces tendae TaxID=1932 RepID=UPI00369F5FB6